MLVGIVSAVVVVAEAGEEDTALARSEGRVGVVGAKLAGEDSKVLVLAEDAGIGSWAGTSRACGARSSISANSPSVDVVTESPSRGLAPHKCRRCWIFPAGSSLGDIISLLISSPFLLVWASAEAGRCILGFGVLSPNAALMQSAGKDIADAQPMSIAATKRVARMKVLLVMVTGYLRAHNASTSTQRSRIPFMRFAPGMLDR